MGNSRKIPTRTPKRTKRAKSIKLALARKKLEANARTQVNNQPSVSSDPWDPNNEYESIINSELYIEKEKPTSILSGYRIVEINHVLNWAMKLQYGHSKKCTNGIMKCFEEKRFNFKSDFLFKCNVCEEIVSFSSESSDTINDAAIWGTISAGSTYSQMQEIVSAMDIPKMSKYYFFKREEELGRVWEKTLHESLEAAGKEERELAIAAGDVDEDGKPYVTVIQ